MEPLQDSDPTRVGRYEIVARLGSGGMGLVYLARAADGERFALKMIHGFMAQDPQWRRRFQREVIAAQRVTGSNTAALVEADPDGNPPWMATEFVDGPTLSELIERGGPLTLPSAVRLAEGMARALINIHRAGLVHRDLKPSNVLLGPEGAMLIDFGIAQANDGSQLTATGLVTGSPGFMSPEQAQAEQVTAASDVFALGTVLFYAATGARPFGEGSLISVTYRVVHAEPNFTSIRDDGLRALIADCLAKDPADRPTPEEILERCPSILDGSWHAQRAGDAVTALAAAAVPTGTGALTAYQPGALPIGAPFDSDLPGSAYPPVGRPAAPSTVGAAPRGGLAGFIVDLRDRFPKAWIVLPISLVALLAGTAIALAVAKGDGSDGQSGANDSDVTQPTSGQTAPPTVISTPSGHHGGGKSGLPITGPTTRPTSRVSATSTAKATGSASVTPTKSQPTGGPPDTGGDGGASTVTVGPSDTSGTTTPPDGGGGGGGDTPSTGPSDSSTPSDSGSPGAGAGG
jgi:hypothetical protein